MHVFLRSDTGGYHVGDQKFSPTTRSDALAQVRAKFPFMMQLRNSAWNLLGPLSILSLAGSTFIFPYLMPYTAEETLVFTVTPYVRSLWFGCV